MPQEDKHRRYYNDVTLTGPSILDQISKSNVQDMFNKESGFFDLPTRCSSPEHNPPSHIHIPHGKGYRHICPRCKNIIEIIPPQITL